MRVPYHKMYTHTHTHMSTQLSNVSEAYGLRTVSVFGSARWLWWGGRGGKCDR